MFTQNYATGNYNSSLTDNNQPELATNYIEYSISIEVLQVSYKHHRILIQIKPKSVGRLPANCITQKCVISWQPLATLFGSTLKDVTTCKFLVHGLQNTHKKADCCFV